MARCRKARSSALRGRIGSFIRACRHRTGVISARSRGLREATRAASGMREASARGSAPVVAELRHSASVCVTLGGDWGLSTDALGVFVTIGGRDIGVGSRADATSLYKQLRQLARPGGSES